MKKIDELKIGDRFVDMLTGEIAELSAHLCMVKMCKKNHFCVFNYGHLGDHGSLLCKDI